MTIEGRAYAQQHGSVRDTPDGYQFTPASGITAETIDAAIARAAAYGTTAIRLWRELGDGWYAASSHAEHVGFGYVCQIDERTGDPVGCECIATYLCHHLGAAIAEWRERIGWARKDAEVQAIIDAFGVAHVRLPRREEPWL